MAGVISGGGSHDSDVWVTVTPLEKPLPAVLSSRDERCVHCLWTVDGLGARATHATAG